MQISELAEITSAELRDDMYMVVEDSTTTYKISLAEFKEWIVAQSKEQTRGYINKSIDNVTEALKGVKLLPESLKFVGDPQIKKEDTDPYGLLEIKYDRPEFANYMFKVTDLTTGTEVFRTRITDAEPMEAASFVWNLRKYDSINNLSDEEKEASGFEFFNGKYVYRNIDVNDPNILIIENNNDNIITAGTQVLLEIISNSLERIRAIYTVTAEDVAAVIKN